MLFSEVFRHFGRATFDVVFRGDPKELGPFMLEAFEVALKPSPMLAEGGLMRQQIQALGRMELQTNLIRLAKHAPDKLTPLASLFWDPEGDEIENKPRKRPVCCNSTLATAVGQAFVSTHLRRRRETTGKFLLDVFTEMHGDFAKKLFTPLGRDLILKYQDQIPDSDALQEAWKLVKTNRDGLLDFSQRIPLDVERQRRAAAAARDPLIVDLRPAYQEQAERARKAAEEAAVAKQLTEDEELAEFFRKLDEDPDLNAESLQDSDIQKPAKVSDRVNIKHKQANVTNVIEESFETYRYVLDNEPAFIAMHEHPVHGLLLVMIAIDGRNDLGQMVHRGAAVLNPVTNELESHRDINSVIGPFQHTDESGAKYVVKAIPWRRGLCGRYWTNVKKDDGKNNDIPDLKRWFILTIDENKKPFLRIWSGRQGEEHFYRYMGRFRRRIREIQEARRQAV